MTLALDPDRRPFVGGTIASMIDRRLIALSVTLAMACLTAWSGQANNPATAAPRAAAPAVAAAAAPATRDAGTVTGSVVETMNRGGYTYVRLRTGKEDVWIAASEFPVKSGERLTAPLEMPMQNFHSKTLNRDFPVVYFVSQIAREGHALSAATDQPAALPLMGSHQSAPVTPGESMSPSSGGLSMADVWARRTSLAGKPVVIRGKVVKVNNGIMDRNWLHLQDGSGSAADRTNDLTVTTAAVARVGDIVTAAGVLTINKDFSAGYVYDAILEGATVRAKLLLRRSENQRYSGWPAGLPEIPSVVRRYPARPLRSGRSPCSSHVIGLRVQYAGRPLQVNRSWRRHAVDRCKS